MCANARPHLRTECHDSDGEFAGPARSAGPASFSAKVRQETQTGLKSVTHRSWPKFPTVQFALLVIQICIKQTACGVSLGW